MIETIQNQAAANAAISACVGQLNDTMLAVYRAGFVVEVGAGGKIKRPGREDSVRLLVVGHFTEEQRQLVTRSGDEMKRRLLQSKAKRLFLWLASKL